MITSTEPQETGARPAALPPLAEWPGSRPPPCVVVKSIPQTEIRAQRLGCPGQPVRVQPSGTSLVMIAPAQAGLARPRPSARRVAVGALILPLLAGCGESCPPPQVVMINNTPAADAGQSVLLTVMIGVAFVAAGIAGVFAWIAARQRSRREAAERAQRLAEDDLLVVRDRANGRRARYDLPEAGIRSTRTDEAYRVPAEDLRLPAIERGRS